MGGIVGRGKNKWRQLAHHQLISQQRPHLVHTVKLKPIIKRQISGKLVTSGINDVAIVSVHSEKTRLKMIMIIFSMNKSQKSTGFGGRQKLTSAMKLPRKVMIDFKFDALQVSLHREPPVVRLVEKLTRNLYW